MSTKITATAPAESGGRARRDMSAPSRERLQALERGLEVLAFVNRLGNCASGQVAKGLRLKRSTAHRILSVLVSMELLRHDPLSHQYILCSRVRELSSGFKDDEWVTGPASTRMSAWTRQYRWPLLLTTPLSGFLMVRASTDHESPQTVGRLVPGQTVSTHGLTVGILYRAYANTPLRVRDTAVDATVAPAKETEDLAAVRRAGFVARISPNDGAARISVPLIAQRHFFGCISMRCRPQTTQDPTELKLWVTRLKKLAREIRDEVSPMLGLQH